MIPFPFLDTSYQDRASLLRRATALLVAAAANLLLMLMLLRLASGVTSAPPPRPPVVIALRPESPPPERERAAARQERTARKTAERAKTQPLPTPAETPPAPVGPLRMIIVSREVFRASDISKLPQYPAEQATGSAAAANAQGDSSSDGPGTGPNGERLYNAEWYREPTHAELAYYLPAGAPDGGWALIACRTAARFRVEDCIALDDSPPGSGLARAMRQAAWQFLVRPPRVGGRTMVGAWVRIRIDFTRVEKP